MLLLIVLLLAVLDHKFLQLRELNFYTERKYIKLGSNLQIRSFIVTVLLMLFIISPIFALGRPIIKFLNPTVPFGETYAILFVCFHLGFIFHAVVTQGFHGFFGIFIFWGGYLERLWLIGLNAPSLEQYDRHGRWRWAVIGRSLTRWAQTRKYPSAHFIRVSLLFGASLVVVMLANFFISGLRLPTDGTGILTINQLIDHPQAITGILVVLSAPIAFIIWFFRDQNNLWVLENSRKDINLKDFQKLAEWAAGLHLPEDKISHSVKVVHSKKSITESNQGEATESSETLDSTDSATPQSSGIHKTHSRRDGAIALQVAAIYQMQAFLRGDFGKHFQRPAFQLLKSVWMALTQSQVADVKNISGSDRKKFHAEVENWRKVIYGITSEGVGGALTQTMSDGNGQILREHANDLPRITLAGWNGTLPSSRNRLNNLVLDGLNFQRAQLQGINMRQASCSRVDLSAAKLFGADFSFAHMQRSDLRWMEAPFSIFNGARMQGSLLDGAILLGADLFVTDLRGASLDGARLQSACLNGAKLEGARLLNIQYDQETDFSNATADKTTIIAVATPKIGLHNSSGLRFPDDFDINQEETNRLKVVLQKKGLGFID
jgi:uncharacterized protein YjbI with pentapeptide repeats